MTATMVDLGGEFAPRPPKPVVVPMAPDPVAEALARLADALECIGPAVAAAAAEAVATALRANPGRAIEDADIADIVNAVNGLRPGASAEDIADAIARRLHPPEPGDPSVAPLLEKLVEKLELLDFRLKGVGGGGGGGAVKVNIPTDLAVRDRFASGEHLEDQPGAGGVLDFAFSAAVDLVWVRCDGGVGRADPFGGVPDSDTGIYCADGEPQPVTVTAAAVKVHATAGSTVRVWGFRY